MAQNSNGNDMGNVKGWDDETAPNFYWGSGALRLYDNHYTVLRYKETQ